jgi:hypothetical protein
MSDGFKIDLTTCTSNYRQTKCELALYSGGNLGGAGAAPTPPPPSRKIDEFSEILT